MTDFHFVAEAHFVKGGWTIIRRTRTEEEARALARIHHERWGSPTRVRAL